MILVPLLISDSVIHIQYAVEENTKPSKYYAVLTTNTTHRLPVDSTRYEAVEVTFLSDNKQTIIISPTTENISSHNTLEYRTEKNLTPMPDDQNALLMRYWPVGLAVTGTIYCETTTDDDVVLIWTWSSIFESKHEDMNAQIHCSQHKSYQWQHECPYYGETINIADILETRGNNEVMLLGACATGRNTARARFKADFKEEHYNTNNYPHYSMGLHTDNPKGITLPLTERNHQTYLYITVTGTQDISRDVEVLVNSISFSNGKDKKIWQIVSIIVGLVATLHIIFTYLAIVIYSCKKYCTKN